MEDETGKGSKAYDELGRVKTVTDANGQSLTYAYDEYGRISKISYPKGREVVYNYDKDDNIIRVADSKGITADFTYDAVGVGGYSTEIYWGSGYGDSILE